MIIFGVFSLEYYIYKESIWEGKRNMKPIKSEPKQKDVGDENIIIEIKNKSAKNICENITSEKKWTKNCPICNRIIFYVNKYRLQYGIENKTICKSCRTHTKQTKQKMSGSGNGMYGVHRYNNLNPFYGKQHSEESKRKMRIAACKKILRLQRSKNGRFANSNPKEHEFFNKLEKDNGWDGIYCNKHSIQYFLENLGYFVDYYEPHLNIVVEYDEPRHYVYGNLKEKDIKRMSEIKSHLKCKFLRYNEYTKELKEY